ncbi:amidase family protein [Cupriavidus necator]|uniref:amidase family protein n=1 Tax=Cupriavidus necator TaxID=106590 RepID=UPI00068DB055|nr:amidase family protein [Cupriavidus necator]
MSVNQIKTSICTIESPKDLWRWSGAEISASVRRGDVSAVEVVESVYARIAAVNPVINGIVHMDRERALVDAGALDRRRQAGDSLGPLAGVPVSIKLNVDVAGEATSNGNPLWLDRIAEADSGVVSNLRRAGAVVIGRTNTPPHSFRWFTENPAYGRTRNPWSSGVTSGGSSGGAGAAVASGMGPIAHGTDIAGSIRYPAYVNGVVGLRATTGRIPGYQATAPQRFFGLQAMSAQGPLARTVSDARLALEAMASDGGMDPVWVDARLNYKDDETPTHVALVDEIGGIDISPEIRQALSSAAAALTNAGYTVERIALPDLIRGMELWESIVMTECRLGMLAAVDAIGDATISTPVHNMAACAPEPSLAGYAKAIASRDDMRRQWNILFQRYPLVLMPTSCCAPLPWGADQGSVEEMRRLLEVQSPLMAVAVCGLPGLHVPTGLSQGLPVGVQLVAPAFREMRLLHAGAMIEAAHGTLIHHLWEGRW